MKILTLGLGAFGFAINKHLGENNNDKEFYCLELKKSTIDYVLKTREHPYFFKGYKLPQNICIIQDYNEIIGDIDLLILAIPAQCIGEAIDNLKNKLKPGIVILNLAKGIDFKYNMTISQLINKKFCAFDYNYMVLSGGMIASELVENKKLGADLACDDLYLAKKVKKLFRNVNLKINLKKDVLNIELYGSFKNIMAIIVGYYEGKGEKASTIGYYISEFYNEMKDLLVLYNASNQLDFSYYSLGGDIIATCFGNSRNKYFGYLLAKEKDINKVLKILKFENKHSEGYETIKAVIKKIGNKEGFLLTKKLYNLIK